MRAIGVGVAVLCTLATACAGQDGLAVRVLDSAQVLAVTLRSALAGVRRIFRRAGIETRWTACSTAEPDCNGGGDLMVRVIRRPVPQWKGALAAAIQIEGSEGVYCTVFYAPIEAAARRSGATPAIWLAQVMAHEAAHLLGLADSHRGIMHDVLGRADIERAERGQLAFTAAEAERLRGAVAVRIAARPKTGDGGAEAGLYTR